jgi:hypothetical protein
MDAHKESTMLRTFQVSDIVTRKDAIVVVNPVNERVFLVSLFLVIPNGAIHVQTSQRGEHEINDFVELYIQLLPNVQDSEECVG